MIPQGSPNYLRFTPYQISSRSPLSFSSHWFLIQILTSIANLSTYGNSHQIYFSSANMVANGWFKMYLNHEQLLFLKNSNYFELYPIENVHKTSLLNSLQNEDCYVYASNDWEPPTGAHIVSRVTDTLFRVKNLTIDESIKHDQRILTIKSLPRKKTSNRYNSGFLQSHHQKSVYDHNIYAPLRSLHNIGINGTGQIINIVDTGVDALNAFFYDPDNSLETISGKTNPKHRKILRIEKYADDLDYYTGHGTHVAGIAAGSAYCAQELCGISQYNGIASGCKIYFSDVGYSSVSGDLSEEFDLNEQAKLMTSYDAYISSNSWSYDYPIKEDMFAYDQISYKYPNILYFFAAGNDYSYFSINSPSCSKNVVSVGATEPVSASSAEFSSYSVIVQNETVSFNCNEKSSGLIRKNGLASKMSYIYNITVTHYFEYNDENNSTKPTQNTDLKDKIVILNDNDFTSDISTDFCTAYRDAVNKGAKAIIYYSPDFFSCGSTSIPTISASVSDFEQISTMKTASILPYSGSDEDGLPNVASLSSKGPSDFALSKPDIAVPGSRVISAKSHGTSQSYTPTTDFNSNLAQMSGTSMATPAAAALGILIRQFLRDGFYPGLTKNSGTPITPSSTLMRAFLINSAVKPDETISRDGPNNEVGFGIPCLDSVFGFKGSGLRIVDNVRMNSYTHHVYHVFLESNEFDFVATMAYLDPPLNPDNDNHLFADLDLFVKSPNGKFYVGNSCNGVADSDSFSSAEKVVIGKEEIPEKGGDFEIHITSTEYALDSQKVTYSLVVNGPFKQTDFDKNPLFLVANDASESDCLNRCSGNGVCSKSGLCKCSKNSIGLSCNTSIMTIIEGQTDRSKYTHKQIRYFRLEPSEPVSNLTFVDFTLLLSDPRANLFFCTSNEQSPGQITNADWDCHMSKKNDYSIEISPDNQHKSILLAVYISYHQDVNVVLSNIIFTAKDRPSPPKKSIDKRKILFIAGCVVCGLIFAAILAGLIVLIVKLVQRRKKEPIVDDDINEAIVATADNYDANL